jgi:putative hydrolase of the HAD superfamily
VIAERSFDILLFDLGGVLIDFAGFEELSRLLPDPPDPNAVRRRWINCEPVRLFERGGITADEFANRFLAEWPLDLSPDEFLREFIGWARGLYPGAARHLRRLSQDFRIACLSNTNALHAPLHRQALEPHAVRCYFSNELGLLKPQREIFDHVIRDLATPPARIAFFDDTEVNVEAAERVGMSAYLVDGMTELEQRLEELGLMKPRIHPEQTP